MSHSSLNNLFANNWEQFKYYSWEPFSWQVEPEMWPQTDQWGAKDQMCAIFEFVQILLCFLALWVLLLPSPFFLVNYQWDIKQGWIKKHNISFPNSFVTSPISKILCPIFIKPKMLRLYNEIVILFFSLYKVKLKLSLTEVLSCKMFLSL